MHRFNTAVLILTFAFGSLATAEEAKQKGKMHAEAEAVKLMLLRQKSVREDLKLDKSETEKIFEFTHKQQEAAKQVFALPEGERKTRWENMTKENEQFLSNNLKPEQRKRLDQIAMQTAGLLFVTKPSIAKELNLTEQQQQEARKLQQDAHAKVAEYLHSTKGEARNEKFAEFRKATHEKLEMLLTADQRSKWKELAGKPFSGKLLYEEPEKEK